MREIQDLKDFSIHSWYEAFEHITLKTIILELSGDVLKCFQFEDRNECSDEDASEDSGCEEAALPGYFIEKLNNAFNTLGKTVFVKNNWHAPTDAKMFSIGNTLKAESADDIKMFFTTSTVIQKDLSNIKGICFYLAIRKWISIHPAAEFRCIIVNNILRGITSRDWPTFYAHFKEEGSEIVEQISNFFGENIKFKFPRKNYVVDVVLSYPDKPFLLDFGPLNSRTNLYAFSWKEIGPLLNKETPDEIAPVFRYLDSEIGIMTRESALMKLRPKE